MSSPTEHRIAAALGARADLVTHADLRPLDLPAPRRRGPRPGLLLLAAAAATVAVGAPFVLTGDDVDDPAPPPAGTPTPAPTTEPTTGPNPTPSPSSGVGLDSLTEYDEQRADVDGDGRPDRVRLLLDDTAEGVGVVEVRLAEGGTLVADIPIGYASQLEPPLDLNGDGREQVLLPFTQGGDFQQLLVYTWFENRLVLAEPEGRSGPGLGLDGSGRTDDYYVTAGGLSSWTRGDPVDGSTSRYTAPTRRWTVEGDRLVSSVGETLCVDITQEEPPGRC